MQFESWKKIISIQEVERFVFPVEDGNYTCGMNVGGVSQPLIWKRLDLLA